MKIERLRTPQEEQTGKRLEGIFGRSKDSVEVRLENFLTYARRKTVTRFITLYELFQKVVETKGSVVDCVACSAASVS